MYLYLYQIITKKLINFFSDEKKKDRTKYESFYKEFCEYLKEGALIDESYRADLAKLFLYETAQSEEGKLLSLDEYIATLPSEQNTLYFLFSPTRSEALLSPYYEAFKKNNINVIFVYTPVDDLLLSTMKTYQNKKFVSCETTDVESLLANKNPVIEKSNNTSNTANTASKPEIKDNDPEVSKFVDWLKLALNSKASEVKATTRLVSSPAMITSKHSSSLNRMMRMVNMPNGNGINSMETPRLTLEINLRHPFIQKLNELREKNNEVATLLAEQMYDNCCISAGLMNDPRNMIPRLNNMMNLLVEFGEKSDFSSSILSHKKEEEKPVKTIPKEENKEVKPPPSEAGKGRRGIDGLEGIEIPSIDEIFKNTEKNKKK